MALTWSKPKTEGGAPITGYHVERMNPATLAWEKVNLKPIPAKETHFVVSDLPEGELTSFRVLAENEAGLSDPSESTPDVVVKDPESMSILNGICVVQRCKPETSISKENQENHKKPLVDSLMLHDGRMVVVILRNF